MTSFYYTANECIFIPLKQSFSILEITNQLGNVNCINSIKDAKKLVDYVFGIFRKIFDQAYKITGNHYMILIYFYELIDLLKVKYNKTSFIIAIHMCLDQIHTHMRDNMHSKKSNYELLSEVLNAQ